MSRFKTLSRGTAVAKLGTAKSVTYYYQARGGVLYEREMAVEGVAAAFAAGHGKLRVDLETSEHVIVVSDTKKLRHGYRVEF